MRIPLHDSWQVAPEFTIEVMTCMRLDGRVVTDRLLVGLFSCGYALEGRIICWIIFT